MSPMHERSQPSETVAAQRGGPFTTSRLTQADGPTRGAETVTSGRLAAVRNPVPAARRNAPTAGGGIQGVGDGHAYGPDDAGSSAEKPKAPSRRKQVLLRLHPQLYDALARWAGDELRSTNAQIEFVLRAALAEAGRQPGGQRPAARTAADRSTDPAAVRRRPLP